MKKITVHLLGLVVMVLLWPTAGAFADAENPNRFNRLFVPDRDHNPPLAQDGIHDPANEAINLLQPPKEALGILQNGLSGNYVDWEKSLESGKIKPLYDLEKQSTDAMLMDLNIVRQVKGSMPDVVYPHKAHTEWLTCSSCHPELFIPKKGANSMTMAEIMLGQKCGVCHGKVAFPVSECRRCHSQEKASKSAKVKTESEAKDKSAKTDK